MSLHIRETTHPNNTYLSIYAPLCALFSYRFGSSIYPSDSVGTLLVSAFSGSFLIVLAMLLVLVVINYLGLRNVSFISFIPLVLSYVFGFAQLFTTFPEAVVYASPFTSISSLLYTTYSGLPSPVELSNPTSAMLQRPLLLLSLCLWTLSLGGVDVYLLGKIRPRAIEEARQV
ncbi:MAG: hypothetical protein QXV32_00950 [Conexivisphaerales archaeon]